VFINCSEKSSDPSKSLAMLNILIGDSSPYNHTFMSTNVSFNGDSCSGTISSGFSEGRFDIPVIELGYNIKTKVYSYMDGSRYKNNTYYLENSQYYEMDDISSKYDSEPSFVRYVSFTKSSITPFGYPVGIFTVYFDIPNHGTDNLVDISCDISLIQELNVILDDFIKTVFIAGEDVSPYNPIDVHLLKDCPLSFTSFTAPVFFDDVVPTDFDEATHSIHLRNRNYVERLGIFEDFITGEDIDNNENDETGFCFDPCMDCREGTWGEIAISGRRCTPALVHKTCYSKSPIRISTQIQNITISCGKVLWETRNGTCPFGINTNTSMGKTMKIPRLVRYSVIAITSFSGLCTVLGISSLIGLLFHNARSILELIQTQAWVKP